MVRWSQQKTGIIHIIITKIILNGLKFTKRKTPTGTTVKITIHHKLQKILGKKFMIFRQKFNLKKMLSVIEMSVYRV